MTIKSFKHIATRVFDTPLLISEPKLTVIANMLGERMGMDMVMQRPLGAENNYDPAQHADQFSHLDGILAMTDGVQFRAQSEGHYVGGNIAVVPIIGTLVQRSDWMSSASGMTSYADIERMMSAAMNDPNVSEIIQEYDTPGGEVAGAFDAADRLAAMRGQGKKITAVASEFAASAGFLLASTADEIVVPRTGAVGSIGVVTAHYDISKAMEKKGVVVTYIYAGDKKVLGNPHQSLSPDALAELQGKIDEFYGLFVGTVAKNMGIDPAAIRATQAGMYTGRKAVDIGLATRVNSFANEIGMAVLRNKGQIGPFRLINQVQEIEMTEQEIAVKAEAALKAKQEMEANAALAAKASTDAAVKAASLDAVKAERERIKAITGCDEAKGREALAQKCIDMNMTVEQSKEMLAAAPKASGNRLDRAMEMLGEKQVPNIEGGAPEIKTDLSQQSVYGRRAKIFSGKTA